MVPESVTPPARSRVRPPADLLLERETGAVALVAGPWSLSLRGAELDDITFDGVLVARSIRLIARDEDWGTLPMQLDRTELPIASPTADGALELSLSGRAGTRDGVCAWTLTLRIDGAALSVDARMEATAPFRRNRLGLIVLHPPGLAGRPLAVEHPDGTVTRTEFPERISPHQPAHDISALSWRAEPDGDDRPAVDSSIRFSGDVFEMEDQRNWTDASFKTYSTPLSKPFPVELLPGAVVEQAVELRCVAADGPGSATGRRSADLPTRARVHFGPTDAAVRLPVVTTSLSSGPHAGSPIPAVFGPLICELDPGQASWPAVLDRAVTESGGRPIDLRLIVEHGEEATPVWDRLQNDGIAAARIGVFHRQTHVSEPGLLTDVQRQLRSRGIPGELIGGTRAHFTELNRNFSRLAGWDGPLSFSITPFMHDRSGHQLVESVAMQRLVIREALSIANGRTLHVGPITLGARFNAVATSAPPAPRSGSLDDGFGAERVDGATDLRQGAPSLGAWALASVEALAVAGVASLSYFEASGARGLLNPDGQATAAGDVLGWIAELSGGAVAPLAADHPAVVGLAVADSALGGELVSLVGNLGDTPLIVGIDGFDEFTLDAGAVRRVTVPAP